MIAHRDHTRSRLGGPRFGRTSEPSFNSNHDVDGLPLVCRVRSVRSPTMHASMMSMSRSLSPGNVSIGADRSQVGAASGIQPSSTAALTDNRYQSVLGISRDSDGFLSPLCGGIVSSMSEPHLPSMSSNLDSPPLETPPSGERSPFTSIPVSEAILCLLMCEIISGKQDAFFRRRTGSRWLSQTKSGSTSRTATNEASFEVEVRHKIRPGSGLSLTVLLAPRRYQGVRLWMAGR